jgi:hypothetical protein
MTTTPPESSLSCWEAGCLTPRFESQTSTPARDPDVTRPWQASESKSWLAGRFKRVRRRAVPRRVRRQADACHKLRMPTVRGASRARYPDG